MSFCKNRKQYGIICKTPFERFFQFTSGLHSTNACSAAVKMSSRENRLRVNIGTIIHAITHVLINNLIDFTGGKNIFIRKNKDKNKQIDKKSETNNMTYKL